jgi:hypothetical protein
VTSQKAAASAPFNTSVTGVLAARDACNRLRVNSLACMHFELFALRPQYALLKPLARVYSCQKHDVMG